MRAKNESIRERLTMPVRNVLVGDTRRHVEHDDTALTVDVVPIAKTAKLLLTSCVPHIELDRADILCPYQRCPTTSPCVDVPLTVVNANA